MNKIMNKLRQIEEHHDVPLKVQRNVPSNSEGKDGDKKIVTIVGENLTTGVSEDKYYLYHKINKEWFKVELERA